jgi:CRP/FNR family transcriptional regulator
MMMERIYTRLFCNGQSFGEPPLFIDEKYPSTAAAFQDSKIIKLSKDKFLKIIDEYPGIQKQFLQLMAKRIHSKTKTSKDIINQKPEFRILAFLNAHKKVLVIAKRWFRLRDRKLPILPA